MNCRAEVERSVRVISRGVSLRVAMLAYRNGEMVRSLHVIVPWLSSAVPAVRGDVPGTWGVGRGWHAHRKWGTGERG